ncbi:MAG: hypothetical protein HZB16_24235 [Armatimonadetes bacterium]|nr:hypothetical protein [Armatimonadota bacterium]
MRRWSDLMYLGWSLALAALVGVLLSGASGAWLGWALLPLAAGVVLGRCAELSRAESFAHAAFVAAGVAAFGSLSDANPGVCAVLAAGSLLTMAGLARWGNRATRIWVAAMVLLITLGAAIALNRAVPGAAGRLAAEPSRDLPTSALADQPEMFLPLDLDDAGRRVALWSILDSEQTDDAQSIWSLDVNDGTLHKVFHGYPLPLLEWSPAGDRLVYPASEKPWDEGAVPFGIHVGAAAGGSSKRLPAPADGGSWMYPSWSKQGNRLGVWRLPEAPEFGSVGPLRDLPRSFVLSPDGGEPTEIAVKGCRLSLLSAWEAGGEGALMMTEHGIYLVRPDAKPKRLVAAGEAPLDPFPMPLQSGVAQDGKHIAYLELTFKGGDIDRIDVNVIDMNGRGRGGIANIVPLAMGWSADGKLFAALTQNRRGELLVNVLDPETRRVKSLRTGLKRTDEDFPCRLSVSRDGKVVAINGPLDKGAMLSVAMVDLTSGETKLLPNCHNHLASGWRPDGWLVVSDTQTVSAVSPAGQRQPIFVPSAAGRSEDLCSTAMLETTFRQPIERLQVAAEMAVQLARK